MEERNFVPMASYQKPVHYLGESAFGKRGSWHCGLCGSSVSATEDYMAIVFMWKHLIENHGLNGDFQITFRRGI
uniref:Uncharacterized protein n=1 Tax=viral metagenome TaxID=1070528 RepID=A0A6M3L5X3_9ZZZZ